MSRLAVSLRGHMAECAAVRGETNKRLDSIDAKFGLLNRTAWRAVGAIALAVLVAVLGATSMIVSEQYSVQQDQIVREMAQRTDRDAKDATILRKLDRLAGPPPQGQ